jgi:hypothetical protein
MRQNQPPILRQAHFGKLLDAKRSNSYGKTLQQTISMFLFGFMDAPQDFIIRFVKALGKFVQELSDTLRETMLKRLQLAEDPSKPKQERKT